MYMAEFLLGPEGKRYGDRHRHVLALRMDSGKLSFFNACVFLIAWLF